MNLKQALKQLDSGDDAHWTADGLPRIDYLATLVGNPNLKRGDITNADPSLVRLPDEDVKEKEGVKEEAPTEEEILLSKDLLREALGRIDQEDRQLYAEEARVKKEHLALRELSDRYQAALQRLLDKDPEPSPIQHYMASKKKIREEKEKRRQKTLDGVDVDDLLDRFQGGASKLDHTLAQRNRPDGGVTP